MQNRLGFKTFHIHIHTEYMYFEVLKINVHGKKKRYEYRECMHLTSDRCDDNWKGWCQGFTSARI